MLTASSKNKTAYWFDRTEESHKMINDPMQVKIDSRGNQG